MQQNEDITAIFCKQATSTGLRRHHFTLPLDHLRWSGTVSSLPFLAEARLHTRLKLVYGYLSSWQSHFHYYTNLQCDQKSYFAFITISSA